MNRGNYPLNCGRRCEKMAVRMDQEKTPKGGSPDDFEFFNQAMKKGMEVGRFYLDMMNTFSRSVNVAFDREPDREAQQEIQDEISQKSLKTYQEIIGKYLTMPQLGLGREALQKGMLSLDACNRLMISVGEFVIKFNIPFKEAMDALQRSMKEKKDIKSPRDLYDILVPILDERYDDYLKSPEGVQDVMDVIEAYLDYEDKLNGVREEWFKSQSLPSKKDMDEVYRNIHHLKKRMRQQTAIIREQEKIIEGLNKRVRAVEKSQSMPKKKRTTSVSGVAQKRGRNAS
jgi:hypothetical protein